MIPSIAFLLLGQFAQQSFLNNTRHFPVLNSTYFSGIGSIGQVITFVPSSIIITSENMGSTRFHVCAVFISSVFLASASF